MLKAKNKNNMIDCKKYYTDKETFFETYFDKTYVSMNDIIKHIDYFFYNSKIISSYDENKYINLEFINALFIFSAQNNNIELTQYLLNSPKLSHFIDLTYDNYEAIYKTTLHNNEEVGQILVKEFYKYFKKVKGKKEKEKYRIPNNAFEQACFNNCELIVDEILNCSKNFYIGNIKEAFINSYLSLNFKLNEKIFNASIVIKKNKLFSQILDFYPHYSSIYKIIAYDESLLSKQNQIKIISHLLKNPILNPENYPNYVRKTIYATNMENILGLCYKHNDTEMLDFLLENEKTQDVIKEFINPDFIKKLINDPVFNEYDIHVMINYCVIDLKIPRTRELFCFLKDICENENIERKKEIAQAIIDLYDVVEFNDKLEKKVEKKSLNANKKKKL